MKLDWNQIALGMGESAAKLRMHCVLNDISSTNDWHIWSENGIELPAVCLAEQQLRGRGRNGKAWVSSPDENIYLSLVWSFKARQDTGLTGLSLALGIVVARLMTEFGVDAKIKWPNDVVVNEVKLAGILIETKIKPDGEIIAIIGIGMNYALSELSLKQISQAATDFVTTCKISPVPGRNRVAGNLIRALMQACEIFDQQGFNAFRTDWNDFDICSGRMIQIKDAAGEWSAYAMGINEQCGLKLLRDDVEHVVYAADVSVRVS